MKDLEEEEAESDGDSCDLPCYYPALMGCRNVECYEWLNRIEEGAYGVVHRGKDKRTGLVGGGGGGGQDVQVYQGS